MNDTTNRENKMFDFIVKRLDRIEDKFDQRMKDLHDQLDEQSARQAAQDKKLENHGVKLASITGFIALVVSGIVSWTTGTFRG